MADKATITATSYEQASREIQSNNNYAIGCLLHLYNHQTMDEQMRKGTVHQSSDQKNIAEIHHQSNSWDTDRAQINQANAGK